LIGQADTDYKKLEKQCQVYDLMRSKDEETRIQAVRDLVLLVELGDVDANVAAQELQHEVLQGNDVDQDAAAIQALHEMQQLYLCLPSATSYLYHHAKVPALRNHVIDKIQGLGEAGAPFASVVLECVMMTGAEMRHTRYAAVGALLALKKCRSFPSHLRHVVNCLYLADIMTFVVGPSVWYFVGVVVVLNGPVIYHLVVPSFSLPCSSSSELVSNLSAEQRHLV